MISRSALLGLFLTTSYVRPGGLGQALADHLPRLAGKQVLAASSLLCVLIAGLSAVWALLLAALIFVWLRQVMLRRLGGTTGDTAGALLELLEVAMLAGLALI
ncbi:cobalamin synthase [compost metagenome]